MRQILNVNIPKSWQELPDRELRFVFRLLQGEYSLTQIKTLCLLRWGQLKVVRRKGAVFIVRHHKKNYPLTTLQICESTEALAWLGDFYECYEDDAEVASEILGITLTERFRTGLRMAGFPHHALDTYLPKLIRAGQRVAICDQLEAPKATAKRDAK